MTEITQAEREVARKEILDMLALLQKACGDKNPRADALTRFVRKGYHELFALADELRGRIELLEESATKYRGVHDKAATYHAGDMVTAKGGLWFAEKSTRGVPGTPNSGFRLMHKTPTARGGKQ
jgi:hypothetical protein